MSLLCSTELLFLQDALLAFLHLESSLACALRLRKRALGPVPASFTVLPYGQGEEGEAMQSSLLSILCNEKASFHLLGLHHFSEESRSLLK